MYKSYKEAGIDGIEIHAVHEGYLLDQFAAEGLSVTPDVWDRLEADRRQALEDDLEWIRRGRESCG